MYRQVQTATWMFHLSQMQKYPSFQQFFKLHNFPMCSSTLISTIRQGARHYYKTSVLNISVFHLILKCTCKEAFVHVNSCSLKKSKASAFIAQVTFDSSTDLNFVLRQHWRWTGRSVRVLKILHMTKNKLSAKKKWVRRTKMSATLIPMN